MFGDHTVMLLTSNTLFFAVIASYLKKESKNNKNVNLIYSYILNNPGSIVSNIVKKNNLNKSTVKYYIHQLENKNMVFHIKYGKYTCLFSRSISFSNIEKFLLIFMSNVINKNMLSTIFENHKITNHELSDKIELDKSNIHRRLKILIKRKIVIYKTESKVKYYTINEEYFDLLLKIIK
jgi:predicted transcriptional regulator